MAKPNYHMIYNYDSGPIYFQDEPVTPEHVDQMVAEVADAGADVLLVSVNSQTADFPSKTWQRVWDGYVEGDESFFVDVPKERIPLREHSIQQAKRLAEQCDYLERAMVRCRHHGIAPGLSMRMNDMHGGGEGPKSHMRSKFYQDNPQFHIKCVEARGYSREALDYRHPQVRERAMELVRELVENYDIEVLELDFMRFAFYFDRFNIDEHCEIINGFMRQVRDVISATGRDIKLIPRVASSPEAARLLGSDVQAWAREGLVDGITPTQFINTGWEMPLDEFRKLVGSNIAVYAGTMAWAQRWDGIPPELLVNSPEMLRGLTTGYQALGADGINLFNFFCCRQNKPPIEPCFGTLAELKDKQGLRDKSRRHLISGGQQLVECDLPSQVPVFMEKDETRRFEMVLAAEGKDAKVTARIFIEGQNKPEDLWLRIGMHSVGHAVEIQKGPEGKMGKRQTKPFRKSKIAVFNVPPGVIKDGRNELVFRCENDGTVVLGLDVRIDY